MNATCLFEALDNIMQSIHPRLTVRTDIRDHLHWMPNDDIHCYISCWFDCILLEYEVGRPWRRSDVVKGVIGNLPVDLLKMSQSEQIDVPYDFHISRMTGTIRPSMKMVDEANTCRQSSLTTGMQANDNENE